MQPLDLATRKTLKLGDAVSAEANATRSWLPDEPVWGRLEAAREQVAQTLGTQLAKGYQPTSELLANMRKRSFGVRPLAVWSPLDRIMYRALTDRILKDEEELDQSGHAYLTFVTAPVKIALSRRRQARGIWLLSDTDIEYVVRTDVTSFYQYIDHALLAEQLLLRSNDFTQIDALVDLLKEVQGRSYGLPQMLQPSDRLAEIYIQAVERRLVREGWLVSRYNDDFRISCFNYAHALEAIERFANAAREMGLVMNEEKTSITRLENYVIFDTPIKVSDGGDGEKMMDAGMSPDEFLSDYTDAVGTDNDPEDALNILRAAYVDQSSGPDRRSDPFHVGTDPINVAHPSADEIRQLRRALNKLTRLKTPGATDKVPLLIAFIPNLTPNAARYLTSMPTDADPQLPDVLDTILTQSLNTWQQIWLLYVFRQRQEQFDEQLRERQQRWVRMMFDDSRDPLTRAEAALTAAVAGIVDAATIDRALDAAPSTTAPWYVVALDALGIDDRLRTAVAGSNPLYRWLL